MISLVQIIRPSSPLYTQPSNNSQISNECMFGESFQIFNIINNYAFGKLLTDNYEGWINLDDLAELPKPSHRVLAIRTIINDKPNIKASLIHYLPLGSQVKVKKTINGWAEIELSRKHELKKGYIPFGHLVKLNHKIKDWVKITEQFIGTPYKWGGRDSLGVDCSALVQLSLQAHGINFPRDTSMQINSNLIKTVDLNHINRGCLIFWEGHIAVCFDKYYIIHANSYSMSTKKEKLEVAELRIGNKYGSIIKVAKLI
jgi:hypothetical protein